METKVQAPDPDRAMKVGDPNSAPFIYFENTPCFGAIPGVIRITLSGQRTLMDGDRIVEEEVAVAHLRCNLIAAKALKETLERAILMAEPNKA